jgi:hypothetical protein
VMTAASLPAGRSRVGVDVLVFTVVPYWVALEYGVRPSVVWAHGV